MNILYDIGKVLLDFDFETSLTTLLPTNHPDPRSALNQLLAKKDEFEAGHIHPNDYIPWALETLKSNASDEQFILAWRNIFTPNQAMWDTVKKLASENHTLILFSNTNSLHCPWIFQQFPDFSLFQGAILSYQVGTIKPRPDIYQHAISKFNLTPAETLYIDDLPQNIETGKKLGFITHQYDLQNHPAFESWLSTHLPKN